ncbi:MAG: hypothetical protein HQL72_11455 [Magnetococcales bacterium]|nr:hypothetical protein [Magnetococcales bacterium]
MEARDDDSQAMTQPDAMTGSPSWQTRAALLALLPVVAFLVYWDGQHYDPGLLVFQSQAKEQMIPANLFPDRWGGLKRVGEIQRFDKENLYEYVNGHAEFFISSGFLSLALAEYGPEEAAKSGTPQATVELYHMGKPLHAFGTLMDETGAEAVPVEAGSMGFRSERDLRFIQGAYYIKISAFADSLPLERAVEALTQTLSPLQGEALLSFDFPLLGQTHSTRFIKENYRGLSFLGNILERTFNVGEKKIIAFLLLADPALIRQKDQALLTFFQQDQIPFSETEIAGLRLVRVEDPYEGDWFYLPVGERLLGLFGVSPEESMAHIKGFFQDGQTDHQAQ